MGSNKNKGGNRELYLYGPGGHRACAYHPETQDNLLRKKLG